MAPRRKGQGNIVTVCIVIFVAAAGLSFLTNRLVRMNMPKGVEFVSTSNPELDNAIATAQQSLPQFEVQLSKSGPTQSAVKVRFNAPDDPAKSEMMWVNHLTQKGDSWTGILADKPAILTKLKQGYQVKFKTEQIVDWEIIYSDGTHDGAFTDDVLMREGKKISDGF